MPKSPEELSPVFTHSLRFPKTIYVWDERFRGLSSQDAMDRDIASIMLGTCLIELNLLLLPDLKQMVNGKTKSGEILTMIDQRGKAQLLIGLASDMVANQIASIDGFLKDLRLTAYQDLFAARRQSRIPQIYIERRRMLEQVAKRRGKPLKIDGYPLE